MGLRGFLINLRRLSSKTGVITLLFIMLASLFAINIMLQKNFAASNMASTNSEPLSMSISPSGPIQLQLNQSQILIANTNSQDAPLTYSWSVDNSSSNSWINETNYLLVTRGNQAVFKFLSEDIDICWLSVTAYSPTMIANSTIPVQCVTLPQATQTSQQTTNQQTNQSAQTPAPTQTQFQTSSQNYTSLYTTNPILGADLIVKNDATSHYQVINATDNSIISSYSSSSANSTLNKAIATGGTIAITSGDYSGSQLIVPSNANIISAPDVIGIKYASIGDGARINEPDFNSAFGGYRSGSYTVITNVTALATVATWYLALKPDNTIYYASTNASYVLNSIARLGGGIFVGGNLTLTSPIILSKIYTSLYSDGTGQLFFKDVDGVNITTSGVNVFDLEIRQASYGRTKTGITCCGTPINQRGYETFSNLKLWGWKTALSLLYTSSSQANNIDTTFSYTGLNIWGQSVNNFFSNCQFSNYGTNQTTVLIQRDDSLDVYPEGNTISNSLIYGGNTAIYLRYAFASQISGSIIDGWTEKGVLIVGSQNNAISNNWIGCSPSSSNSTAVEVCSNSTNITGNNLYAYNWTIYLHSSSNCLINDNIFSSAAAIDVFFISNNGGSIASNNFCSPSQIGILVQNSEGFSIYSNTFTGKGTAINIITSEHNSVVSNIINGTQQNGIILDGSPYNSITGNSIYNSGQQTDNAYSDVWLIGGSTYDNVCDNTITALSINRSAWGILESSSADDYNMYSGNILAGQASGAIGVNGAHSLREANIPIAG